MSFKYLNESILSLIRSVGQELVRDFYQIETLQITAKGVGDFVTCADKKSEKTLIEGLSQLYPGYNFLCEESGQLLGTSNTHRWIIDPLDATKNFIHGIPIFAISVALEVEGSIVLGVIYAPMTDEMFYAEKGEGAFCNGNKIAVSKHTEIKNSFISAGTFGGRRCKTKEFENFYQAVVPFVSGTRHLACAAIELCYVAAGRYELFFELSLSYWDIAAGVILVKEAGGKICDFQGTENYFLTGDVIATNAYLFPELHKIVSTYHK